ncbi:MAG: NAD-dependent epimerase/dehydratase family protein [Pirellulales bacterium]|nr:NAD-dependent epimerase/dehydratase family protein [Pirellulales bacterium]
MARALVTGASGFIGKRLVETLASRGDTAVCLVRPTSDVERLKQLGAMLTLGDVAQPDSLPAAVADIDVVYHVAGLTKANSYDAYRRVNEVGVQNILAACAKRTTPPRVILVSSLSAAGPSPDERLRVESDPAQPVSNYGKSKRAGELAAEARAADMPITVFRPPIVLGGGDEQGFALFRSVKRLGIHLVGGYGKRFSIVYVDDLVSAMISAAEKSERLPPRATRSLTTEETGNEPGCGYYFVAGPENPLYSELGTLVGIALDKPHVKLLRTPKFMMRISATCGTIAGRLTGRARYLCLDRAKEILAGNWICSPEKAHRDLAFTPCATLEQQLRWTAEWYCREGWL